MIATPNEPTIDDVIAPTEQAVPDHGPDAVPPAAE